MIPSLVSRQLRETVLDYLHTTFALADGELETALFNFLDGPAGLFRGPFIDIRLPFRKASPGERVPLDIRPAFDPYKHQLKAFQRLYSKDGHQPQHTLVTTGTGSGKTECFLYPVLDHCYRNQDKPGIKAIVLYPMNALASDQARRLAEILWNDTRLRGKVSAGLYVGGQGQHGVADQEHLVDKRDVLRDSPPDILLTNYKMLDFLLLRPEDRRLWEHNGPDTLRYLVLDELHSYDGAQGSDVACLIRRLKNRLTTRPGSICCVGTSATIGDASGKSGHELTRFASQVFDEDFFDESLVVEDRLSPNETFPVRVDLDHIPLDASSDVLNPQGFDDVDAWAARQVALWFGDDASPSPEAVGGLLERHELLRDILKALGGSVTTLAELDEVLARRHPEWAEAAPPLRRQLLDSYLGLISYARRRDGDREIPFLTVQVQLWVRELRHLLRRVRDPASGLELAWESDLKTRSESNEHWLPVAYCRECGHSGWATLQMEGKAVLEEERSKIGLAWLRRYHIARYVKPGKTTDDLVPIFLNPTTLGIGPAPEDTEADGEKESVFPVLLAGEQSQQTPPKFLARCPDCGADQALSILGSRAPSLLSVLISDTFSSPFNFDKKLLAFTDSVQDASHRAGFFGARTYRFNLRTAMQAVLEEQGAPIPLRTFAQQLFDYWGQRLEQPKLVATLLPSDLRELPDYVRFQETKGAGSYRRLVADLVERLSWETIMEYGLRAHVGRTLEVSRCSTSVIEEGLLTRAAGDLCTVLNGEQVLESVTGQLSPRQVRHFIAGLLHRTRLRGGVYHPFLKTYVESGGRWFHLTRKRNRLISPFGRFSVFPRFLVDKSAQDQTGREDVFDCVFSAPSSQSWYRDWAARSLGVAITDGGMNDLYRESLEVLTRAGVLVNSDLNRQRMAWGLNPDSMAVTPAVVQLDCDACRRSVVVGANAGADWTGEPCLQYRCGGHYRLASSSGESYYSRIFRSGRLHRIFAGEHTGLLQREERERLEERFKTQSAPDAENLVVATPTLEMGIDIGDLSATVLCSVPPTVANYLQRIGRAGRKTGNALCVTLANSRPHDLYFHALPLEMLAGEVLPPGCFLNAPEMLRRQMFAHAMDAWAREDKAASAIPFKTSLVLSERGWKTFPGRFLEFYQAHRQRLTQAFLERFEEELSEGNREALRAFGVSDEIPELINEAFDRIRRERKELRAVIDKTQNRMRQIERNEEELDEPEEELRDLRHAKGVITRLVEELDNKYPLNVLTDEGALPNYAFPEAGVSLDSVLKDTGEDGSHRYETRQFVRPASSAIRELAPFNTFYAEGRKVRIDEIDIGSKAQPLIERWRFCPACAHSALEVDDTKVAPSCPRCGENEWSDSGQVGHMVHFRRSRALAGRLEASTYDDSDDRDEEHYRTLDLIDVGPKNYHGARIIAGLPFGYELLRSLALREINFGKETAVSGGGFKVAGQPIGNIGFAVCMDCGRVQQSHAESQNHAPYCRARKSPDDANVQPLFLYRQLESEGIRILLPVSEIDLEESRSSFKAALDLGFRRHFHGAPGHLQIKYLREPVSGGGFRQFLLIFDAVPGGTGYLSELWRDNVFLHVLERALQALQSCACQREPERDGCYRCIYAYQRQTELDQISSRRAQRLLQEILSKRDEFELITTLSAVSLDSRLESELETKFVATLRDKVSALEGGAWSEGVKRGQEFWRFTINGQAWEMQPQQDVGRKQGVSIASRPDFVIAPANADPSIKRIAVFCDGLAFHACPDKPEGRIWDDIQKRKSQLASDRYLVWSVTWKDLDEFQGRGGGRAYWGLFEGSKSKLLGQLADKLELELARETGRYGSCALLLEYLAQPDGAQWSKLAQTYAVGWLATGPWHDGATADVLKRGLTEVPDHTHPGGLEVLLRPGEPILRLHWGEHLALLGQCQEQHLRNGSLDEVEVVLRLFDGQRSRQSREFEAEWRKFLHAWNLLQFLPALHVTSSELIERMPAETDEPAAGAEPLLEVAEGSTARYESSDGTDDRPQPDLREYVVEGARPMLSAVLNEGLPAPEIAFELTGDDEQCGPAAELAWPSLKLCVLFGHQVADAEAFQAAGWTTKDEGTEPNELIEMLRQLVSSERRV